MKASQILKSGTEHAHQVALFNWAAIAQSKGFQTANCWLNDIEPFGLDNHFLNEHAHLLKWMHAIPNGGSRGDDAKTRAIRGGQLKAEGVKPGVADVFLPVMQAGGRSGLYIEMKKPGGRVSEDQSEFAAFVQHQNFEWSVAFGVHEAAWIVQNYLKGVTQ